MSELHEWGCTWGWVKKSRACGFVSKSIKNWPLIERRHHEVCSASHFIAYAAAMKSRSSSSSLVASEPQFQSVQQPLPHTMRRTSSVSLRTSSSSHQAPYDDRWLPALPANLLRLKKRMMGIKEPLFRASQPVDRHLLRAQSIDRMQVRQKASCLCH